MSTDLAALYDAYRQLIAGRRLPLAWADLERVDRNLDAMAERAAGRPIRIASKSLRCPEMIARVLAHPAYRGVLGFTPAEAAFLHERFGIDDIVVAGRSYRNSASYWTAAQAAQLVLSQI